MTIYSMEIKHVDRELNNKVTWFSQELYMFWHDAMKSLEQWKKEREGYEVKPGSNGKSLRWKNPSSGEMEYALVWTRELKC